MVKRSHLYFLPAVLLASLLTACATPLPPSYDAVSKDPVLEGPVLAIAGKSGLVAAVNNDGLYIKAGDSAWKKLDVPGVRKWGKITSLAVDKKAIYLGSDGEGLHIFSEGTWEVKTSRYGGLPDDGVLTIAVDGEDEGLPGSTVWVGTHEGIAANRNGEWKVYRPGKDWVVSITGNPPTGSGRVYLGAGFKLGRKGEESRLFRPPVTAIGVGADRIVFGSRSALLAVIGESGLATINLTESADITGLVVDGPVIWAATGEGLLWGGLKGEAKGKPWPRHHVYMQWSGYLFGTRDSKPFEYRWKRLGYNSARVVGLQELEGDLWVAYRAERSGSDMQQKSRKDSIAEAEAANQVSAFRRFPNIEEYIASGSDGRYENYGSSSGVKGTPTAMFVSPDGQKIWVGTTKGLWELEQY